MRMVVPKPDPPILPTQAEAEHVLVFPNLYK